MRIADRVLQKFAAQFPRLFVLDSDVLTLHLSRAGSDAIANGTVQRPFKTFQAAFDFLSLHYGPVLEGRWRLQPTAGTYPETVTVAGLRSKQAIGIFGPSVVVNTQPSVIIDGDGVSERYGWQFLNDINVYLEHVEFKNWDYDAQSAALYLENHCKAYLKNGWFTDNHWGVEPKFHCNLRVNSGKYEGNTVGAYLFTGSVYDFGDSSGDVDHGPIFRLNSTGIIAQEVCSGHTDFCTFSDNTIATEVREGSRMTFTQGGEFINNATCIKYYAGGSVFVDEAVINFNQGTPDSNARIYDGYSGGRRGSSAASGYQHNCYVDRDWQLYSLDVASHLHTGDTADNSPFSLTVPGQLIDVLGKGLRIHATGFYSGAGTKIISVYLGTTIISFTTQAGVAGQWVMDVEVYPTSSLDGADFQRVIGEFREDGQPSQNGGSSRTLDLSVDTQLFVTQKLNDASGSSTITTVRVDILA